MFPKLCSMSCKYVFHKCGQLSFKNTVIQYNFLLGIHSTQEYIKRFAKTSKKETFHLVFPKLNLTLEFILHPFGNLNILWDSLANFNLLCFRNFFKSNIFFFFF